MMGDTQIWDTAQPIQTRLASTDRAGSRRPEGQGTPCPPRSKPPPFLLLPPAPRLSAAMIAATVYLAVRSTPAADQATVPPPPGSSSQVDECFRPAVPC